MIEWYNVIDKADHSSVTASNTITGVVVGGGAGSICHSRGSLPLFVLHLPTIPLNWSVISSSTFRFTRDPSHQQTQVKYTFKIILAIFTVHVSAYILKCVQLSHLSITLPIYLLDIGY